MPDFDYKQVAKSPEYLNNFPKIFSGATYCSICGKEVWATSGVFYPHHAEHIDCAFKEVEDDL